MNCACSLSNNKGIFVSSVIDHRQLADEMQIYFIDEHIGAGLPVWLPNGVAIREALENFIKKLEQKNGYHRVVTPHVARAELYQMSGHLRAFRQDMFPPMKWDEDASEYYLKPMNCPHHHKIFASSLKSYRHLPFRVAEYGQVYRYENSGSLRGLSRARGLCQNDAHIYVEPQQAEDEILHVLDMHEFCYSSLNMKGYRYRLSTHDPSQKHQYDGEQNDWLNCERILRECLIKKGLNFYEAIGEAAFYGPKIDVQMPAASGHDESIASIQLDFNSSVKFNLKYIAPSGQEELPWIIHRAPLGSHERFVAMLLEYYSGQLPAWLSPVQLYLLPVNEQQIEFVQQLKNHLVSENLRVQIDTNSGSLAKRIHFAHKLRPFAFMIIGENEKNSGQAVVQLRNQKKEAISLVELSEYLKKKCCEPT